MAMELKKTATGAGRSALTLLKILVLGFWFGGGLLAMTIVSRIISQHFAKEPLEAVAVNSAIVLWFSTAAIIASAVLAVLLFLFERRRRAWWVLMAVLAVLGVINAYGIAAWMRSAVDENTKTTLRTIHESVFFAEVALAFGLLAALAFARRPPSPAVAVSSPLVPPEGTFAVSSPLVPPEGTVAVSSPLVPPEGTFAVSSPLVPPEGTVAAFDSSPFESPERPAAPPPAAPDEPPAEDRGPDAGPRGEGGAP
jgi:hypothetical protein